MKCLLCNHPETVPSGFKQLYKQHESPPVLLNWYTCYHCNGWFNYPPPTPEQIGNYWKTVPYNDPALEKKYLANKRLIYERILALAGTPGNEKKLLDFGSNFGQFLDMAKQRGWLTYGFEPFEEAARISNEKGHITFSDFEIKHTSHAGVLFDVIVANDSFCYVWHPYDTIQQFYRILQSGGKLIMRLSNKKQVIAAIDALLPDGDRKNTIISKILQAQFHSISAKKLKQICIESGFKKVSIQINATTAPASDQSFKTNLSYRLSSVLYYLSFGAINISPGILFVAEK